MDKSKCYNCGKQEVTAYAGMRELPLCTECWTKLHRKEITLKEIEAKNE